jgi:hypothetical protein
MSKIGTQQAPSPPKKSSIRRIMLRLRNALPQTTATTLTSLALANDRDAA